MKKAILLLFLVGGNLSWVMAGKPIHMTFDFVAIDAYTNAKTEGITVGVYTMEGELLFEGKTNANGRYSPDREMEAKEHEVRVYDEQDRFVAYSYSFYVSKKWSFHSMELALYPSKKVLDEWTAAEDEAYGLLKTGTLDPAFNNDSLFYGCTMDELGDASFSGGIPAMNTFIINTIRYPQVSVESGEQGKVFVKFVIEPDGKLTHIEIERSVSPLIDGEAIRVVRTMPDWSPGTCGETKLRTLARLPLSFNLN